MKIAILLLVVVTVGMVLILSVREYNDISLQENYTKTGILKKSNSWFSSAYKFPTEPIYLRPLVFKIQEKGIGLSYPTVNVDKNTIYSGYREDCLLSFPISGIERIEYGDWNAIFKLKTKSSESVLYVSQDSPYIYIYSQEDIDFRCQGKSQLVYQTNEDWHRIIVLPDNANVDISTKMSESKWEPIKTSNAKFTVSTSTIETTYKNSQESTFSYKLLYPHHLESIQYDYKNVGSYATSRGEISLVETNSNIITKVEKPDLPDEFKIVSDKYNKDSLIENIEKDIVLWSDKELSPGTYFKGTELGALSSLALLSNQYDTPGKRKVLDKLEAELVASLKDFNFSDEDSMVFATNAEFGSEEGNDHHFHYGYYIRAASVLLKYRPELAEIISPTINLLVADIASTEEGKLPRLRNFSVYEGHSWASGWAPFADGNNQESVSEALNAWYAIKLWGQVLKEKKIEDLGYWLFSQELEGAKSYWYGINNPFPLGYKHSISSIIWGGKRDFATWFSAEPLHIHGIQLLPITPASKHYLSEVITEKQINEIKNSYIDPTQHEWGDLYVSYLSEMYPEEAKLLLSKVNNYSGTKLKSVFLQSVYANLE